MPTAKKSVKKTTRSATPPKKLGAKIPIPEWMKKQLASRTATDVRKLLEDPEGIEPLDLLRAQVRDSDLPDDARRDAAKAAIAYTSKRKPQAVEIEGNLNITQNLNLKNLSDEELAVFGVLMQKLTGRSINEKKEQV